MYQIPTWASLVFILLVLAGTFGLSWRATHRDATAGPNRATTKPDPPRDVVGSGIR